MRELDGKMQGLEEIDGATVDARAEEIRGIAAEYKEAIAMDLAMKELSPRFSVLAGHGHLNPWHFNVASLIDKRAKNRDEVLACHWMNIGILEDMRYWVDGILPSTRFDIAKTLRVGRPALLGALGNGGPKLSITMPEALPVNAHEGTMRVLLFNICRNAYVHGAGDREGLEKWHDDMDTALKLDHLAMDQKQGIYQSSANDLWRRKMHIEGARAGKNVVIALSDNGKGVNEKSLATMFKDRPLQKKEIPRGLGLGLVDADKRMALMGGNIRCEPHGGIDGGAKFLLEVEAADA